MEFCFFLAPISFSQLPVKNVNVTFPLFIYFFVTTFRARACVRERERASECVSVSVRCGLRFICCLRNTITFLLSDRVSRHTRDRARQCALETGDGEQGHPNHPPHLQTESRSLNSPSHPPTNQPNLHLPPSCSSTLPPRDHSSARFPSRHTQTRKLRARDTRLDYFIREGIRLLK